MTTEEQGRRLAEIRENYWEEPMTPQTDLAALAKAWVQAVTDLHTVTSEHYVEQAASDCIDAESAFHAALAALQSKNRGLIAMNNDLTEFRRGDIAAHAAEIERLRAERDELQAIFDLRWAADMRAIKRWQEAHPGNDLVWPGHADLVVWLLEKFETDSAIIVSQQDEIERLTEALEQLADAADTVGVQFFDTDTMEPEVEAMQAATQQARAALRAQQPSPAEEKPNE